MKKSIEKLKSTGGDLNSEYFKKLSVKEKLRNLILLDLTRYKGDLTHVFETIDNSCD